MKKLMPSCESFCICCPALRPSSRSPVKRYKKLLADIFPKTPDGSPNERKIVKLCEYAAKNPLRIPKIVKILEQRIHKELHSGHVNFINIITEAYKKLLIICKEQMAYFAVSLSAVLSELLDCQNKDVLVLGCHTLTGFVNCQADNTYERSIEKLISKVCELSHHQGEESSLLRAASLQCLSAMVQFMNEHSHIFAEFDKIIFAILDNYPLSEQAKCDDQSLQLSQHNWVDEIVRCEGRAGSVVGNEPECSNAHLKCPAIKDSSTLTREERESPGVWSHICVQKLAELAKESTTMRRVLDPMFAYFDAKRQWRPNSGLALLILSDMSHQLKTIGSEKWILSATVRHLDHKNVLNDPQIKLHVLETATIFARQLRCRDIPPEIAVVDDLCRHIRKSLEASELAELKEVNFTVSSQNFLEDCLTEIIKGVYDLRPLYDMIAFTLENLSAFTSVARATLGSLLVLSHIITLAPCSSDSLMVFPETLLLQLLKSTMHTDLEVRLGAHYLFASIIVRNPHHTNIDSEYLYETKKWQSRTNNVFASATALLEKLRREKEVLNGENTCDNAHNNFKERNTHDQMAKYNWARKHSAYFSKLVSSIIHQFSSKQLADVENKTFMLTADQTTLLLSSFWMQANLADNSPFDFEAIARSYSLTLVSSQLKNSRNSSIVRFFQLPISLRNMALAPAGALHSSCQRSLFLLATCMLGFAGNAFRIMELADLLEPFTSSDIDPFMKIGEGMELYVRSQEDLRCYGSEKDQQSARVTLSKMRTVVGATDDELVDAVTRALVKLTKLEEADLIAQLTETFIPETPFFGLNSSLDWGNVPVRAFSEESLSFNEECSRHSSVDESPATTVPSSVSKLHLPPSPSHVLSVGELLESALYVAGQVVGTSVSTSPLPYGAMASQCEALGSGTKQLSSWLVDVPNTSPDDQPENESFIHRPFGKLKMTVDGNENVSSVPAEPWMKLPPASPFDNFLKAAGC